MGYLDNAGLQYLWGKLKEKFAPKSHSHDDRYYTESEMDGKLNSKVNNTKDGASSLINKLDSATGIPVDSAFFVSQYSDGTQSAYYRRPVSTLWTYIKGKADGIYQPKGSYASSGHTHSFSSITDKPSTYTPSAHNQSWSTITDKPALMESGDYSAETIEALLKQVQGLSPRMGSCCLTKDTHVANTWWNFIYTPHRTGSGGDNPEYGTLLLFPMVGAGSSYIVRAGKDGIVREVRKIYTSGDKPTKVDVGLGNVDNTADANKSVKYATSAGSANTATKATTAGTADKANSVDWSKVQNKPSTYPPASHTHAYLPTGGGTMSGALNFANCTWNNVGDDVRFGDNNTSGSFYIQGLNGPTNIKLKKKGDTSTGSGDSATITYDGGNLVIDKTIQANLSGNASTATKAVSADKATSASSADKATSASSADKAAKLTTARTVSGGSDITLSFNYDGSGNSTANIGFYSCRHSIGNTNNYPFHRFARLDANKGAWVDKSITFLISQDYSGGGYGICRLVYHSNADSGSASVDAQWLVRRGLSADTVQVAIKTDKTNGAYCDAFYKSSGTYAGAVIRAIASGGRDSSGRTWTLINSTEAQGTTATDKKTSSECWKTIADAGTALHNQAYSSSASAKDEGYVASAGSANTSSSCIGNSASATKLTSSAGSATQPVYFKDGKPVAGTYTLGDASSKTVRTLGAVGNTGWTNKTTDDKYVPTMSFMAYWNGAYSGTSSNLQYCDRGRFGTIVTKGSGDYAAAGHTHNYAGSGSAGGSANSAVKLDSNAGSSVQPVYFSGGKPVAIGYTISSSVPANAKFTDTTYGVASSASNGLMSSTDKTKLDDFSRVINIQKQIKLTTDWLDTGIAGNSLDTGTYVVQVSGFNSSYTQLYSEIYSGVMSWYSGTTNSGNSSEIFLHNAGLADNNNAIYLRTLRVAGSKTLKLQIACKVAATGTDTLTFKFRRLI